MERGVIVKKIRKSVLKIISDAVFLFCLFSLFIILAFHKIVPFFPILFLFDFCIIIGYPLFLRYVLKQKWFECTKDEYLKIKYILLPYCIMEVVVLLYYYKITYFIINIVIKGNG